jgi:hypothetical protein
LGVITPDGGGGGGTEGLTHFYTPWAWKLASSAPPAVLWRFWGLRNERPVSATQPTSPLLLRPPGTTWGGGTACSPFALVQGAGGHYGIGAASHTGGLGPPTGASKIQIPWWGSWPLVWRTTTPMLSRVGSVAKIAVLRPGSSQSAGMF